MVKNTTSDIPLILCTYQRPKQAERLLQQALRCGIKKILVHLDGPKPGRQGVQPDYNFLEKYRNSENVKLLSPSENLGASASIHASINYVLETEDRFMLIEDDLILADNFYEFMSYSLRDFEGDPNISGVSGFNPFSSGDSSSSPFAFSKYIITWGWGMWKTNWENYLQSDFAKFELRTKLIDETDLFLIKKEKQFWKQRMIESNQNSRHIWDYPFNLAHLLDGKLAVYPSSNLVQNIGMDEVATLRVKERSIFRIPLTTWAKKEDNEFLSKSKNLDDQILREFYRVDWKWPANEYLRKFFRFVAGAVYRK